MRQSPKHLTAVVGASIYIVCLCLKLVTYNQVFLCVSLVTWPGCEPALSQTVRICV